MQRRNPHQNETETPQNTTPQGTVSTNPIVEWWQNMSHKAHVAWISGIAAVVALLVGFGVWHHFSPNQICKRIDNQNAKVLAKPTMKAAPKNPKKFDYSGNNTEIPDLQNLAKLRKQATDDDVYLRGQISIPGYDVNVPIYEGIAPSTLAWGAGTSKPGQQMGKGNYALQAHNYIKKMDGVDNYLVNGWFFTNLQTKVAPEGAPFTANKYNYFRITVGTKVYTLDKHNVYTYEVERHIVVDDVNAPGAGKVLADSEVQQVGDHKTPILTLATCYIQYGITYPKSRLVYVCKLDKVTPRSQFKGLHKVFHRNPNAASW